MEILRKLRVALAALALLGATACTRTGINAGEQGGRAFVAMAVMLVAIVIVLAIFLGKEE